MHEIYTHAENAKSAYVDVCIFLKLEKSHYTSTKINKILNQFNSSQALTFMYIYKYIYFQMFFSFEFPLENYCTVLVR